MHPNNIHNKPYDFTTLINAHEALEIFVFTNTFGNSTIDFSDHKAVLELNRAILKYHYGLKDWNIPEGYLCPPIPGRVDYIHHLADMLAKEGVTTKIKGLDIGMGANCIYPILGAQVYDWYMVGADIDEKAVISAKNNIKINQQLSDSIEIRHQTNNANIFEGVIKNEEYFDFTMCNPPFHTSQKEATKGTLRKVKNLGIAEHLELNFGGQANELWCNGGEALFLKRMIKQSVTFAKQVGFFTSLVSKKEHLPKLEKQLDKLKATHTTIAMEQGNKKSRFIVWKF
ncbi:23S rRNA (adenine(1618)-N(6))-methyltransferase RlmF [Aquimarina megaterium]|uniref:23S rRNA (adenine(1618)-N(6))-methyltransferase RlmF n=1 Tax=Aquimarina megaterium TaxID=1443666 RepID=UPI00094374F4|nr:23S rRNA (adenine(1618)-N(6))-methyltransferase RlmF [Aquimarina megaterium]